MLSVKLTSCHNTLNANKLSKIHGTERTRIDMIVAKAATETNVEWLLIQIGVSKRVMKLLNNVSERLVKCRKVFTRIVDKAVKKKSCCVLSASLFSGTQCVTHTFQHTRDCIDAMRQCLLSSGVRWLPAGWGSATDSCLSPLHLVHPKWRVMCERETRGDADWGRLEQ